MNIEDEAKQVVLDTLAEEAPDVDLERARARLRDEDVRSVIRDSLASIAEDAGQGFSFSELVGSEGKKNDKGKPRMDLIPWGSLVPIARVLAHGAELYGAENWRGVKEPERRYFAACIRHLVAWWEGETKDPESGESHLAHAACCVLFLLFFEIEGKNR